MDAEICQQQPVARILAYFMTRTQWIQPCAPLIGPFDMTRSKFLSLTSLAVSPALAVIAAILLLGGPDEPPTRAIASMGPHALATMVLRVP